VSALLPNLSEINIQSRLDYCVKHITDKFSNAVFTDESNFQLAANNQILWYRRDEEEKPHLVKPRNNKKIMIWGGISRKGQTPCISTVLMREKKSLLRVMLNVLRIASLMLWIESSEKINGGFSKITQGPM